MDLESVLGNTADAQSKALDDAIKKTLADIKQSDGAVKTVQAFLAKCGKDDKTQFPAAIVKFMAAQKVPYKAGGKPADNIKNLKAALDKVESVEQADAAKIQALLTKRAQVTEMLTNLMKEMSDTRKGIISNIR